MKNLLSAIGLAVIATASFSQAPATATHVLTPHQALMKRCNAEATDSGKKGKERQAMLNTCVSDGKKHQQQVTKDCKEKFKGQKGDEANKARTACMKG